MIAIDGEDLTYRNQVTHEIFHHNIEVMLDTKSYFSEYNVWKNGDQEGDREKVEHILADFDEDKDGKLS